MEGGCEGLGEDKKTRLWVALRALLKLGAVKADPVLVIG